MLKSLRSSCFTMERKVWGTLYIYLKNAVYFRPIYFSLPPAMYHYWWIPRT